MREWSLGRGDPLALVIACDARTTRPDYCNDQIWQLNLGGGDPPALALETTFGLRARRMRLFPRFSEGQLSVFDPAHFTQPPRVRHFAPDYLDISCSPIQDLDVQIEYRVPQSHVVTGRITLLNRGTTTIQPRIEWVALLNPLGKGQPMEVVQMEITPILQGTSSGLACVFFITGGPEPVSSPYPALSITSTLTPGTSRTLTWALASLANTGESFESARRATARPWEAELAWINRLDEKEIIDIRTGNPDWDAAFALSQKVGFSLLMGPENALPRRSFVLSRLPDQGFSPRGDGSDYNHFWNGQHALDAYTLCTEILPMQSELAEDLLENAFSTQDDSGFIDGKPGLAGQRGRVTSTPCLSSLAWYAYQENQNLPFLERTYPSLIRFLGHWLGANHDRDGDGFPEWDHLLQTGIEDHPIFNRAHPWGHGLDPTVIEDPTLLAWLSAECTSLLKITTALGLSQDQAWLAERQSVLRKLTGKCWHRQKQAYFVRDRDTHRQPRQEFLGKHFGSGTFTLKRQLHAGTRFAVLIKTASDSTRGPRLVFEGENNGQPVREEIVARSILWLQQRAWLTTQSVFSTLQRITVHGLLSEDEIEVYTAGTQVPFLGIQLLLTAGIPEQKRADQVIDTLLDPDHGYLHRFGLCNIPYMEVSPNPGVLIPWNAWIGSGLLRYGRRRAAADLFTRLMDGIVVGLKQTSGFHRVIHPDDGSPTGEEGVVSSLVPLGFFLATLGVQILNPWRVFIADLNPYPWPVTVQYRGLTILREKEKTMLTFPDGQTTSIHQPGNYLVTIPDLTKKREEGAL